MAHAEKCPICDGKGGLTGIKQPCHGCDGKGWINMASREPRLGCATTRQLLTEIIARIEVNGQLDYRTIDGGL